MVARRSRVAGLVPTVAVATVAVALLAAVPAGASTLVKGSSGPLSATLAPSTHTPKINQKWPITVTATLGGKPVRASAEYVFLFAGSIVQTEFPYGNKHFTFSGHYSDKLVFPPAAAGQPLTLRIVVKASGRTVNLNWSITPHR